MGQVVQTIYADALFGVAKDFDKVEEYFEEVKTLHGIFETEKKFAVMLETPQISTGEKKKILDDVFRGKISNEILDFMKILVDKRRIEFFLKICEEFENLCMKHFGIVTAKVYTAYELSSSESRKLKAKLEEVTGSNINIVNEIDELLIGGVKVVIEGKVIDQTALNKLNQLGVSLREISL